MARRATVQLKPLPQDVQHDRLDRLVAIGLVTWADRRPLAPFQPVSHRGALLSDAVSEDRADRF